MAAVVEAAIALDDVPAIRLSLATSGGPQDIDGDGVAGSCDAGQDGDGLSGAADHCPLDPQKNEPGLCGCGLPDVDSDADGIVDCHDPCPLVAEATDEACQAVASPPDSGTVGVDAGMPPAPTGADASGPRSDTGTPPTFSDVGADEGCSCDLGGGRKPRTPLTFALLLAIGVALRRTFGRR